MVAAEQKPTTEPVLRSSIAISEGRMTSSVKGLVSVVLINFRGADDTLEALRNIDKLNWPKSRLEVVVVDNASGDGSSELIRASAYDYVRVIDAPVNHGFAGGCNFGVEQTNGEFVALLNNDAKPDKDWISRAVEEFSVSPKVGAVASKVLSWDGSLVDYVGSAMTWFGMGYKPFTGERVPKLDDLPKDVLFGTGSGMFVRRSVFEQLEGFDESYFMFFEDVDLGWRLNLLGWRFRYVPSSIVYHKHHASMDAYGPFKETFLLERNALFTLFKNTADERLESALAAATLLAVRRGVTRAELDSTSYDLRRGGDESTEVTVSKQLISTIFGLDQFIEHLPTLSRARKAVQDSRQVSEDQIWKLFGLADVPVIQDAQFVEGYENIVGAFNVATPPPSTRVLIVTGDPIGKKLAGPAIRAWHMAQLLSRSNSVRLVSLTGVEDIPASFDLSHVRAGDDRRFAEHEAWADVIIFQGHAMAVFDSLRNSTKILVVDIYDPMHLEQLEQGRGLGPEVWSRQVSDATDVLNQQLELGDFFLCASERQRMFWLGQLAALGRINPKTYANDPDLEGLIAVAPFGLPSTPPHHAHSVLKGVRPGIESNDKLLLWSGGLYNWFDPETLVRAVAKLAQSRPSVKLFFQGTKHPHPGVPEMEIVATTRSLARELGVLDSSVFLNDSWVDYDERENYLLEADAGVSTHFSHIETTFSFRTRILDYLWAGLPMVVTEGDHFADLIGSERLGVVVRAGDSDELAAALEAVLFDEDFIAECKKNIARVRADYFWENALAPLTEFVASAKHAADRGHSGAVLSRNSPVRMRRSGLRHDFRMAIHHLRHGGVRSVADKVVRRVKSRLAK